MTVKRKSRKTKTIVKNAESSLDVLRSDIDALRKNAETIAGDVSGIANEQARNIIRSAESVAERALMLAEEAAAEAGDLSAQYAEEVESWTQDNLDSVRDSVREKPLGSLLVAIGVGVILGAIFSR